MTISKKIIISALATIGLLATTAASLAVEARSKASLNVRSGPGTSFNVLDVLFNGEVVDVTECVTQNSKNWCRIEHTGPDGWVSSNFLEAVPPPAAPPPPPAPPASPPPSGGGSTDPDCSFGLVLGPSGPTFSISCGDNPPPAPPAPPAPPPPPAPVADRACFYTGANYTGAEQCVGIGTYNTLSAPFNDEISSVRLYGNARAKLCRNNNMNGTCRTYNSSRATLNSNINNQASSVQVFTGVLAPVTHSTGPITLPQTATVNLDNGAVGGAGADMHYQVVTPVETYLRPINGAKMSVSGTSNRGFAGCSTAAFTTDRVPLWSLPVGSYVCVKTNTGRISEFRLNGYNGTNMKIGYTTWKN